MTMNCDGQLHGRPLMFIINLIECMCICELSEEIHQKMDNLEMALAFIITNSHNRL